MAAEAGDVREVSLRLAELLLGDVERISERTVDLMQERLPTYAGVPRAELVPVALANMRSLLQVIRDAEVDPSRALEIFQNSGDTRARQGITGDEIMHGWRIGLEVVRKAAYEVGEERELDADALLEFVDATLRWGDVAMRASTSAHREVQVRELGRRSEEQAALRRVATLVARGDPSDRVFTVVAAQVARVLQAPLVRIVSYEADGTAEERARHGGGGEEHASEAASTVEAPIVVAGRVWGAIIVSSGEPGPPPPDTEARLKDFSELVATAISNANARTEVMRLAQAQAALRRVATIVARDQPPEDMFAKVCEEVVVLLPGVEAALIQRYDPDETAVVVGSWAAPENPVWVEQAQTGPFRLGVRSTLEGESITALVYRTKRAARLDNYGPAGGSIAASARQPRVRSSVGSPIVAPGRLWGVIVAATSQPEPLPDDAESRIAEFTELLATAISNLYTRAHVQRLVQEQAALRRVATFVAEGAPPDQVFTKVSEEVGQLLGAEAGLIDRFDGDGYCTTVRSWGKLREAFEFGSRWKVKDSGGVSELVYQTGRPARQRYDGPGSIAAEARRVGLRSAIGSPIVVGGRVWASLVVATPMEEGLPADAESRIAQFADLVGTSIANAQAQSDLKESRARIVAAADEERRQVVRDLHDGAQQHLAHTIVTVRLARRAVARDKTEAVALVGEALQHAKTANDSLRELAHGILPTILARRGLSAGVAALASRMPIPVEIDMNVDRFSEPIEATAYLFVAEALANVAKHARADQAGVTVRLDNHTLHLEVRDNGIGGARADGPGLVGLRDRLAALDGRLRVGTAAGGGTVVAASIPTGDD